MTPYSGICICKHWDSDSKQTNASGSEKKKIEINYWYSWGDKIGENNENLVKKFNESQDEIVVKAHYQGTYDEQHSKAQAAFAAGNAPEVWQNEIASIGVFAKAGMTEDLTSFVQKDNNMNDFIPGLMGNSYVDGKLYGLPYLRSTPAPGKGGSARKNNKAGSVFAEPASLFREWECVVSMALSFSFPAETPPAR